jgi:hypothetical protein
VSWASSFQKSSNDHDLLRTACVDPREQVAPAARRKSADQIKMRGGWSGGGWPRLSGQDSFRSWVIRAETAKNGSKNEAVVPVKQLLAQEDIKMHLSHPTAAGAFDGQHGMSLDMSAVVISASASSAIDDADAPSTIADIETPDDVPAIIGRENGASARPTIITIESSQLMVGGRFTSLKSHRIPSMGSLPG